MQALHYFLLSIFLLASPALADGKSYLDRHSIPPTLIGAPPAPESAPWNADIAYILDLQKKIDPTELEEARQERNMRPELLTLTVDPKLTRKNFPKLYALLDRVGISSYVVTRTAKNYWNTKRPYLMDERIKAPVDPHDNPAYPSGHTSGSYVWAHVLSLLIPERQEVFLARAEEIAQHRVLVGMHFPHDVEGGRKLALLIIGALMQDEEFQQDLTAAKDELIKAKPKANP